MRVFLLFFVIFFSNHSFAIYLDHVQAKQVVQYLDSICADTFCAGDVNYRVNEMTCEDISCIISFELVEYQDDTLNRVDLSEVAQIAVSKDSKTAVVATGLSRDEQLDVVTFNCILSGLDSKSLNKKEEIYERMLECADLSLFKVLKYTYQ